MPKNSKSKSRSRSRSKSRSRSNEVCDICNEETDLVCVNNCKNGQHTCIHKICEECIKGIQTAIIENRIMEGLFPNFKGVIHPVCPLCRKPMTTLVLTEDEIYDIEINKNVVLFAEGPDVERIAGYVLKNLLNLNLSINTILDLINTKKHNRNPDYNGPSLTYKILIGILVEDESFITLLESNKSDIENKRFNKLDEVFRNILLGQTKEITVTSSPFVIPKDVMIVNFDPSFNKSLDDIVWHDNVIHIKFINSSFNKSIDNLPSNLLSLSFINSSFNKSVDNLPKKLVTLALQGDFNKPINYLPKTLKELIIVGKFNQNIKELKALKKLKVLLLKGNFNHSINDLPENLETLNIEGDFNMSNVNLISLQKLKSLSIIGQFNNSLDLLPENLKGLRLKGDFDHTLNHLPQSLESLNIEGVFNKQLNILPDSLKLLRIVSMYFNHPLKNLPIKDLIIISKYFNKPISNLPNLLSLQISSPEFNQQIKNLPNIVRFMINGERII